ncbi:MAG TPA: glycosyltransferase family 39 protein [Casimicrobiaceae bacterium]|nr:glycosyltransferase family 39 protein [Casimicrobiaceae bacterium]
MSRTAAAAAFVRAHSIIDTRPGAAGIARAALIALLAVVALASRTAMPIDETRYLAVAWEMWQRGDFLVPHLNGAAYSHKPPLLFWLIHAGWAAFGVNDAWPRLVAPLCAIATLLVTARAARVLWPQAPWLADRAAWILLGSMLFALFAVMLMFDMLLALCVAIGILGLAHAAQGRARGFVLLALAIGLGVLAKGPATLLHLAPAALLAPWWAGRALPRRRWYAGVALALLGGAALALAWAIPAGVRGGEAYRNAIFWGQTANRMVESFAHRQPAWWYLPWLPLMLAPFLVWRPLWAGMRTPGVLDDRGVRLAVALMLPALAAFSLVSGKQLQYLLPQFPAFALFAARALDAPQPARRPWLAGATLLGIAIVLLALPYVPRAAAFAPSSLAATGAALVVAALAAWLVRARRAPGEQVPRLAAAAVVLLAVVHLAVVRTLAPAWDTRPLAGAIARLQAQGRPLVHDGVYHGQYHFSGRLRAPLDQVTNVPSAQRWIAAHPDGAVIVYFKDREALASFSPLATQPFRGRHATIVDAREAAGAVAASEALEERDAESETAGEPPPRP